MTNPIPSVWRERISQWGAPVTYVTVVVCVGLGLVALLVRSPDTKSNYQNAPEDYHRTQLAAGTAPEEFNGLIRSLGNDPQRIYIGAGCAQCHGVFGEGGVVGPEIRTKALKGVTDAARQGGAGMPAFSQDRLSDAQIASIVTYLNKLNGEASRPPATVPARSIGKGSGGGR